MSASKPVACHVYAIFIASLFLACGCSSSDSNSNVSTESRPEVTDNENYAIAETYLNSSRGYIGEIGVLVLRGTYEEIGEAHGVLAGRDIIDMLDSFLIPYVNEMQADAWDGQLIPFAESFRFPQDYERELQAILDGITLKFPDKADRTLESLKREISVEDLRALNCFNDVYLSVGGCSSFSAWGALTTTGDVICGRNLDERFVSGKPPMMIVARAPAQSNRLASIEITGPGIIVAATSINEEGIIIMGHDEQGLKSETTDEWVPRYIVLREAIETARSSGSVESIKKIFENRSVRIGNNTHFSFPLNRDPAVPPAFVMEWDGNPEENGATLRIEDPNIVQDGIVCTNHYVKRRLQTLETQDNSRERFDILANFLNIYRDSSEKIDAEQAMKMMDSVSENGDTVTYLSVIGFPTQRRLIFAISPGQGVSATKSEWMEITWDQVFGE